VKRKFNIQKLLHRKCKHQGTKPMHMSSSRDFQRHQEHDLKHPSSVDLIIGWSEPTTTNAPVEDEAIKVILGMNQKHILPCPKFFLLLQQRR
jgi:hypothetical protein